MRPVTHLTSLYKCDLRVPSISAQHNMSAHVPTDDELETELRALTALPENRTLGIAKTRAALLSTHPGWTVSEKRVRKALAAKDAPAATTPERMYPTSRVIEGLDVGQWTDKVEVRYMGRDKGKGLVARVDIDDGEVVWKEDPWVIAPEWCVPSIPPNRLAASDADGGGGEQGDIRHAARGGGVHALHDPARGAREHAARPVPRGVRRAVLHAPVPRARGGAGRARAAVRRAQPGREAVAGARARDALAGAARARDVCGARDGSGRGPPRGGGACVGGLGGGVSRGAGCVRRSSLNFCFILFYGAYDSCVRRHLGRTSDTALWTRAHALFVEAFRAPLRAADKKKLERVLAGRTTLPPTLADAFFSYDGFLRGLGRMNLSASPPHIYARLMTDG
jgi:hypothetical protein